MSVPANLDGGFFDFARLVYGHFRVVYDHVRGSDDGPTTLAKGEDVELSGTTGSPARR